MRAVSSAGEDPPRRLHPVEPGHADVHQHGGRPEARGRLDRLDPVAGLGHDFDVLLAREQHAKACPNHRLVVGDEYADAHARLPLTGRRALRMKPPAREGPALI